MKHHGHNQHNLERKKNDNWKKVQSAASTVGKSVFNRIEYVQASKASNAFPSSPSPFSHGGKSDASPKPPPPPGTKPAKSSGADSSKQRELFDADLVLKYMKWMKIGRPGPGLFNMGNTCFLNSTLQCLLHTPALSQIMQLEAKKALVGISDRSDQQQATISQHFQRLVVDAWSTSAGRAISPRSMVHNVRRVGKQFRPQRQEDAHEYLRLLLDCMHEEVLKANGVKLSDGKVAETTFVSRVFGGDFCNELKCSKVSENTRRRNTAAAPPYVPSTVSNVSSITPFSSLSSASTAPRPTTTSKMSLSRSARAFLPSTAPSMLSSSPKNLLRATSGSATAAKARCWQSSVCPSPSLPTRWCCISSGSPTAAGKSTSP